MRQSELFEGSESLGTLPPGMRYQSEFVSIEEEASLIGLLETLPLTNARFKEYTAKRRVVSFDKSSQTQTHFLGPDPPPALSALASRAADWAGCDAMAFIHILVSEYRPGVQLGWHRDAPDYGLVVGISLGAEALMRLRPFTDLRSQGTRMVRLDLESRSIYQLRGEVRWQWQHSVAAVQARRWSITFRTPRGVPSGS